MKTADDPAHKLALVSPSFIEWLIQRASQQVNTATNETVSGKSVQKQHSMHYPDTNINSTLAFEGAKNMDQALHSKSPDNSSKIKDYKSGLVKFKHHTFGEKFLTDDPKDESEDEDMTHQQNVDLKNDIIPDIDDPKGVIESDTELNGSENENILSPRPYYNQKRSAERNKIFLNLTSKQAADAKTIMEIIRESGGAIRVNVSGNVFINGEQLEGVGVRDLVHKIVSNEKNWGYTIS